MLQGYRVLFDNVPFWANIGIVNGMGTSVDMAPATVDVLIAVI